MAGKRGSSDSRRRILEPRCFRAVAPLREQLAQPGVAELVFTLLVAFLLQRQRLLEDEAAGRREAAHGAPLLAGRHQFVSEALEAMLVTTMTSTS